ncbi:MAG: hypothetical protein ACFHU9_08895 [Fluviicola sp.]
MRKNTLIFFYILLWLTIVACSAKPEASKSVTQNHNETPVSDSAYYFFALNSFDTMDGFHQYFEDSVNVAMVEDYHNRLFEAFESTDDGTAIERLFMLFMFRSSFRGLIQNRLVLSRKEEPIMVGRYSGTMNMAFLSLRPKNKFDIHWTGWGSFSALYGGHYRQVSDTLFLTFEKDRPERVGDTLVLQEDRIAPMNPEGSNQVHFFFPK